MNADKNFFQAVISVAAVEGMTMTMRENGYADGIENELNGMAKCAASALKKMVAGMDDDQLRYLQRYIERSEFAVIPKYHPDAKREFIVTTSDVIERLTEHVLGECMLCEKTGKQVKRCQIRKDLIACGVTVECGVEK